MLIQTAGGARSTRPFTRWVILAQLVLLALTPSTVPAQPLSDSDLKAIGNRIWQNESAGKVSGLTAWNAGENFASLGIGHFIWYPSGETGPFEESFPALLQDMRRRQVDIPRWLEEARGCPWPNRQIFLREQQSARMVELRQFLHRTQREQVLFIINRLERTLPRYKMAAGRDGDRVLNQIALLRRTRTGTFALIDYVNFKGDGLNTRERYKGQGWGLLQVLLEMQARDATEAPAEFARASQVVMRRRVDNSPPDRRERRWLPGWLNRCQRYAQPLP